MRRLHDRRSSRILRAAVPGALAGLYSVVQFLYLRPPSSQDGMNYFERAAAFPDVDPDHWSLRVGLLLPVRLFQAVFGYSEAAYYGVPFLAGGLLVLSTYWLGRLLFGTAVGIGAAALLLFSHAFLNSSSILLPDHLAAALFTAALAVMLLVVQRGDPGAWGPREHALLVLVGLLLGWAYLVREFIVFVFPVVVVVAWTHRLPWRKLVWIGAPAASLFFGELALNAALHGSPLERLFVSGAHGGRRESITDSRVDALLRLPRALHDAPGSLPVLLMLGLTPFALAIRERSFRIVAAWFVAFWLPLTLGTGLVEPSFRFVIADKLRYWIPVMPAVLIGGVAVVHHGAVALAGRLRLGERLAVRGPAVLVVSLAVALALFGSAADRARDVYRVNGATQLSELRSWFSGDGADVGLIWTDHFTARLVPLYAHTAFGNPVWAGTVRAFDRGGGFVEPEQLDRGAVVLYRFGYRALPRGYASIPKYIRRPQVVDVDHPDKSLVVYRIQDRVAGGAG